MREKKEERLEITAFYKVNHSDELLSFLLSKCKTSRNNVKSLLSNHQVLVNGSPVTQFNFALAKDDEVKIAKKPVKGTAAGKEPVKKKRGYTLPIIYEDKDFIAVDKPAGLLSVENEKEQECAFSYLLQYLQNKNKALRPFILHRIDKETSGVLVFAKNIKVHSMLRLHWNEYVKKREQYAVVEGNPVEKEKTILSYLKENQNNMVYSSNDPSGQKAITHYRVVCESKEYSLLQVNIDTGRKNQIRVHLHELGYPILGDEKYGFHKNPLKRPELRGSRLEFLHPITKELITIEAGIPSSFTSLFHENSRLPRK